MPAKAGISRSGELRQAPMPDLLEPFGYAYMVNAIWVSALVGAVCAFLSAYLMLKGWSLIGDALSHSVVRKFVQSSLAPAVAAPVGAFSA